MLALFESLSPARRQAMPAKFNWAMLWLGFGISNALLPICALYTRLQPDVVWSGVCYTKRHGRVTRVKHPHKP